MPSRGTILCDVDGVIWLMREPLPGAVDAVNELLQSDYELLFVTNNSFSTMGSQIEAFADIGIAATGRLLTSSMAAANLLDADSIVAVNGGPGVVEAVESVGATAFLVDSLRLDDPRVREVSDVIVGFHRDFDYERLHVLSTLVRSGARLIGTNEDATYPTMSGVIPGGGAILAAVAAASGSKPIVAGKPHDAMADLVAKRLGGSVSSEMWMVGDRLSTDGLFARRLGCRFAHVRSDVYESDVDIQPSTEVASFAQFVDALLHGAVQ